MNEAESLKFYSLPRNRSRSHLTNSLPARTSSGSPLDPGIIIIAGEHAVRGGNAWGETEKVLKSALASQVFSTPENAGEQVRRLCNSWPRRFSAPSRSPGMAAADVFCRCGGEASASVSEKNSRLNNSGRPPSKRPVEGDLCTPLAWEKQAAREGERTRLRVVDRRRTEPSLKLEQSHTTPLQEKSKRKLSKDSSPVGGLVVPELTRSLPSVPSGESGAVDSGDGDDPGWAGTHANQRAVVVKGKSSSAASPLSACSPDAVNTGTDNGDQTGLEYTDSPVPVSGTPFSRRSMRSQSLRPKSPTSQQEPLGRRVGNFLSQSIRRPRSNTVTAIGRESDLARSKVDSPRNSRDSEALLPPLHGMRQALSADNLSQIGSDDGTWSGDPADEYGFEGSLGELKDSGGTDKKRRKLSQASLAGSSLSTGRLLAFSLKHLSASSNNLDASQKGKKTPLREFLTGNQGLRRSLTFQRKETRSKRDKKSGGKGKKEDGYDHGESLAKNASPADQLPDRKEEQQHVECPILTTTDWEEKEARVAKEGFPDKVTDTEQFEDSDETDGPTNKPARLSGPRRIPISLPICSKCLAQRRGVFTLAWLQEWQHPSSPRPLMVTGGTPVSEETFSKVCTLESVLPGSFSNVVFHVVRHRWTGERLSMKRIPHGGDVVTSLNAKHARVMHRCLEAVRAPFISRLLYSWLARPPFETADAHISISELCPGGTLQNYVSLRLTRLPESDVSDALSLWFSFFFWGGGGGGLMNHGLLQLQRFGALGWANPVNIFLSFSHFFIFLHIFLTISRRRRRRRRRKLNTA